MGEKLFTAKEAAEILKVRKNTVYDMIKRGDLKASKLGKQLRICLLYTSDLPMTRWY